MKKVGALLLVVGFGYATAQGGLINFEPEKINLCSNDPGCTGFPTEDTFDLTIKPQVLVNGFTMSDILIGTDDLSFGGFAYSQAFIDANIFVSDPSQFGSYQDGLLVGGFGLDPIQAILLGTLTVTNKNKGGESVAPGEYSIFVDSTRDQGISSLSDGFISEGLFGSALVNIVPEPAVITLLGLGAIGLIRRRRAA